MENLLNAITPFAVVCGALGTVAVLGFVLRDIVRTVFGINELVKDIVHRDESFGRDRCQTKIERYGKKSS